jgi:hypothetical protein
LEGANMKLTMVAGFTVADHGRENQDDDLEQFLDRVMEDLLTLDNVEDSTLTAALARGRFSIMLTVDADLPEHAAVIGMAAIRSAFHAAGASTPDWPTFHDLSIGTTLVSAER